MSDDSHRLMKDMLSCSIVSLSFRTILCPAVQHLFVSLLFAASLKNERTFSGAEKDYRHCTTTKGKISVLWRRDTFILYHLYNNISKVAVTLEMLASLQYRLPPTRTRAGLSVWSKKRPWTVSRVPPMTLPLVGETPVTSE